MDIRETSRLQGFSEGRRKLGKFLHRVVFSQRRGRTGAGCSRELLEMPSAQRAQQLRRGPTPSTNNRLGRDRFSCELFTLAQARNTRTIGTGWHPPMDEGTHTRHLSPKIMFSKNCVLKVTTFVTNQDSSGAKWAAGSRSSSRMQEQAQCPRVDVISQSSIQHYSKATRQCKHSGEDGYHGWKG